MKNLILILVCMCTYAGVQAQSITVKGYGGRKITLNQKLNFDVHRKPQGGYEEAFIKQAFTFNNNNLEVLIFIHSPGLNEHGHDGRDYVQMIDKMVCYYPDIDTKQIKLITNISTDDRNNYGEELKAIVEIYSKTNDKKCFYLFSYNNRNKLGSSDETDEGEYLEWDPIGTKLAFKTVKEAETFKKTLEDKIFDYALNLDAPKIKYPFKKGNKFSEDYPNGKLAKDSEPDEEVVIEELIPIEKKKKESPSTETNSSSSSSKKKDKTEVWVKLHNKRFNGKVELEIKNSGKSSGLRTSLTHSTMRGFKIKIGATVFVDGSPVLTVTEAMDDTTQVIAVK